MKLLKFSENYIPLVFSYHLKSLTHDKILNSDEISERIDFLNKISYKKIILAILYTVAPINLC